jgi:hypothetical protein
MDSGHTSGLSSRIKGKQRIKKCSYMEPACSNIAMQKIVNDHTCYMTRIRAKFEMDGKIPGLGLPSHRDSYTIPERGDYKEQTGLSPPAAYTSTVGHYHIQRLPCTRAPCPCTRKLPISPWDSNPMD